VIVWLNGSLVPASEARVSVFDRGFLFGDGVYEGLRWEGGRVLAAGYHEERLRAGLSECRIGGFDAGRVGEVARAVVEANGLVGGSAFVYVQVTRGAPLDGEPVRSRVMGSGCGPTVFAYAEAVGGLASMERCGERSVALVADTRWTRGHVKGVSLLGNVIGAIEADESGCDDAVFVRGGPGGGEGVGGVNVGGGGGGGIVSEGLATNVFALVGGVVVTPSLESASMLGGVTRRVLIETLRAEGGVGAVEERVVMVRELLGAEEVALVGTRTAVARVASVDGRAMGRAGLSEGLLGALKRGLLRGVDSVDDG